MPNSNPACNPAPTSLCKCESGGMSYDVPNQLTLNWSSYDSLGSGSGVVTLVRNAEMCLWEGYATVSCVINGSTYYSRYYFWMEPVPVNGDESCGWSMQVGAPSGPGQQCSDHYLNLVYDANQIGPWSTTCACSPLDLTFSGTLNEVSGALIEVTA